MYRVGICFVVGALFAVGALGQSQTGSQAGAQASAQTSVQAGGTPAQAGASSSTSAAASAQNGQVNAGLASATTFNAELSSPLDSKKCKPGDAVNGRTTEAVKSQGKMIIPKGSKLLGHVTQTSARAKGEAQSSLGILFDKAILKSGQAADQGEFVRQPRHPRQPVPECPAEAADWGERPPRPAVPWAR